MCDTRWNEYNCWNPINKIGDKWGMKLASWIKNIGDTSCKNLLDYGCGTFSVGRLLADSVHSVDGYDPCPEYIEHAQSVTAHLKNVNFFTERNSIPPKTYDMIVVNSVIQYMGDMEHIIQFLHFADQLLKDDLQATLILSDVIPKDYSAFKDAGKSILYSSQNHFLMAMCIYLWKAATKPPHYQLLLISQSEIIELSEKAGFDCQVLQENLTPSVERYSCVLKRKKRVLLTQQAKHD